MVIFAEGSEQEVLDRGPRRTTLTEYFTKNATDPSAREILYPNFPEHFTWNSTTKKWTTRKRGGTIGRVPIITLIPRQSELFYLRMLLYNKAGATSYADLRTIHGVCYPTFQQACFELGLLQDDRNLDGVLEESASVSFGD